MDIMEGNNSLGYFLSIWDNRSFFAEIKRQFADIFKRERMSSSLDQKARWVQYFFKVNSFKL